MFFAVAPPVGGLDVRPSIRAEVGERDDVVNHRAHRVWMLKPLRDFLPTEPALPAIPVENFLPGVRLSDPRLEPVTANAIVSLAVLNPLKPIVLDATVRAPAATEVRASAPAFRPGVKARAGGPPGPSVL